jgi:hypothetical protein
VENVEIYCVQWKGLKGEVAEGAWEARESGLLVGWLLVSQSANGMTEEGEEEGSYLCTPFAAPFLWGGLSTSALRVRRWEGGFEYGLGMVYIPETPIAARVET